jgi:hypothetical protein
MILSTAKVADFDQFLKTFSTKGAEKRKQHGSKGSHVFRDPNDDGRVWVVFDWEIEDYEKFISIVLRMELGEEGGVRPAGLEHYGTTPYLAT